MFKKLTLSAVGLLLLVSPLISSAQTTSVQAQIDALLKQIRQLQAQIAALSGQLYAPAVGVSSCLDLKNALIIGSTDATTNGEVTKLQRFLAKNKFFGNPDDQTGLSLQPTGYYGMRTADAVMRWQKAHGMDFVTTSSGVGPMTRKKLACQANTADPAGIISSITPSSGPIGTTVEVRGSGLSGFEGDLSLTFEKSNGSKVVLSDIRGNYANSRDTLIRVVVKEPCQKGESYFDPRDQSGLPRICNYVALTPGQYKVYANGWNRSNAVTFTINSSTETNKTVQKISWNIEKANPSITDPNDYHQSEQAIAVDVTFADNSTKRYNLGTAYGCTGSTVQSTENGKTVLGKINCYYSLTGVGFVAYSQNGKFVVERGDESAKDGSVKTTVLLQI